MADAVREFTGTDTLTYAGQIIHSHTRTAHSRYTVTSDTGTNTFIETQVTEKEQAGVTKDWM